MLHKGCNSRPTIDELMSILRSEVLAYSRLFVVVDALDDMDTGAIKGYCSIGCDPCLPRSH